MKTKKAPKTNISRLIFFTIALTYNIILGFHLRDFLVLSPTLQVFYLLSALPTLFLTVKINSKAMITAVYISLMLIACMNISYAIYCRRVFPILAIISLGIVFMYFIAFANATRKDRLLTKICVLVLSVQIMQQLQIRSQKIKIWRFAVHTQYRQIRTQLRGYTKTVADID